MRNVADKAANVLMAGLLHVINDLQRKRDQARDASSITEVFGIANKIFEFLPKETQTKLVELNGNAENRYIQLLPRKHLGSICD